MDKPSEETITVLGCALAYCCQAIMDGKNILKMEMPAMADEILIDCGLEPLTPKQ